MTACPAFETQDTHDHRSKIRLRVSDQFGVDQIIAIS
jgi:hypothetical protein